MMPDLGKYAASVLGSYGASLLLLAGLVWLSMRRARRVKADLEKLEGRRDGQA